MTTPDVTALGTDADRDKLLNTNKNVGAGNTEENAMKSKVYSWFADFGYDPSIEELTSFMQLGGGSSADQLRGHSLIGNYVISLRASQEANANDPTKQVLADEKGFFNSQQKRAIDLEGSANDTYKQLQDTFSSAPKLFGSLDPSQVDKYLAPLRQQALEGGANVQTAAARRGLTGSSTELNSIASNENTFRQNALKMGLDVGMNEQQQQRQVLQNRLGQLQGDTQQAYSFLPGSLTRQENIAQNEQAQSQNLALLKGSLPLYLRSYSTNESMATKSPDIDSGSFFQKYITPFLAPAATVAGAYFGGPVGAVAAGGATSALLKGSGNDPSTQYA